MIDYSRWATTGCFVLRFGVRRSGLLPGGGWAVGNVHEGNGSVDHIGQLKPDTRNPRKHNPRNIGMIVDSLHHVGAARSIVIDEEDNILAGNGVVEAAAQAGIEHVRVVEADGSELIAVRRRGLTEEQRQKLKYYDNQTGAIAEWDAAQIAKDLEEGMDLKGVFDQQELADILASIKGDPPEDPGAQIDRAAELQELWHTELGQLWELGDHRLICGDCTDRAVVERVMGGEKAALCFTSPPYDQQRDYTTGVVDWDALMRGAFGNLMMADDGQVLINLGLIHRDGEWVPYWEGWIAWMREQGWRRIGWYVWDKLCGLPGDHGGRLCPAHEFIFHFCVQPRSPAKYLPTANAGRVVRGHNRQKDGSLTRQTNYGLPVGDWKIGDSVFRCGTQKSSDNPHPAMMPEALAEMALESWAGCPIYDPFLGSGTTMVAAHRLGRKCFGCEIDPGYCAVILERMSGMGLTPVLVEEPAGEHIGSNVARAT